MVAGRAEQRAESRSTPLSGVSIHTICSRRRLRALRAHTLVFSLSSAYCYILRLNTGVMRYAVLVTGPAGAGKSTFCSSLMTHLHTAKRSAHLVNLDPAAESGEYEPAIDIRDLISLPDVMEELGYGPNGGLVYCFE